MDSVPISPISAIKVQLASSRLAVTNNALYQAIKVLIDSVQNNASSINEIIAAVNPGGGGGGGGISGADYITWSNEVGILPNSRNLLAGTGITFDDTVANQRTINGSAAASADYVVASDGATPTPSPLDDGFGNFIYVTYTP